MIPRGIDMKNPATCRVFLLVYGRNNAEIRMECWVKFRVECHMEFRVV